METESDLFTVVLAITEPVGPEIQVMHEEAVDAREAALRALHDWHDIDLDATTTIADLEDASVRVLAVLEGHTDAVLTRTPAQQLS